MSPGANGPVSLPPSPPPTDRELLAAAELLIDTLAEDLARARYQFDPYRVDDLALELWLKSCERRSLAEERPP